ncbi:MAG: ATP-binding protein [Chloroflexota bacterium]|nr:ATP-binding protein [Chloroflexota bacterium]
MVNLCESSEQYRLKTEMMSAWLEEKRALRYPTESDRVTIWSGSETLHEDALAAFDYAVALPGDYRFTGVEAIACALVPPMFKVNQRAVITARTGAFVYAFARVDESGAPIEGGAVEVIAVGAATDEDGWIVAVSNVPRPFIPTWHAFEKEVYKLAIAEEPSDKVMVIGGREDAFDSEVDWEDVVLPAALKNELFDDVKGFFTKGVDVYRRMKLKPFRKLLLAGVPGTGKTMLCAALAKWGLEQHYLVIYVSSSGRWRRNDGDGASFEKIDHALNVAAKSEVPTLLIVEELDIYLRPEHKALILNVLDGSEAPLNQAGTLLIATTNYPEAIDERVLKRPGRLDRIFIIPETRAPEDAEKMLRAYLGEMWQDSHLAIVPRLIGYPGAFIREVAVYALTQVAYVGGETLSLEVLENSFKRLKEQIDSRDDFLKQRSDVGFALKKTTA